MERAVPNPETCDVLLRDVMMSDLPIFFDHQLDSDANRMAAFTARDPADRDAFMAHWTTILGDETITKKTILFDGQVAGSVLSFEQFGQPAVAYWIGKQYWGKGVATRALSAFLGHVKVRPLYARAAKDNLASLRVLKKCGFMICGQDKGFSNARGQEVEGRLRGEHATGTRRPASRAATQSAPTPERRASARQGTSRGRSPSQEGGGWSATPARSLFGWLGRPKSVGDGACVVDQSCRYPAPQ